MKNKWKALIKAFLWGLVVLLFPVASGVASGVARLDAVPTLFLQGSFMVPAIAIPLILVLRGKWKLSDIGFRKWNAAGCKRALYFLPAFAIYIPVAVSGFHIKSASYVLGCLFLYLLVGIAEEVYFRRIVPEYLGKAFSRRAVIIFSTVIFGIGHAATALSGGGAPETALTVLNAFLFGWMAIEIALLSGNIAVPVLLHFLFDFEAKIIAMSGTALFLAEGVRGTLMFLVALWLTFALRKADQAPAEIERARQKRGRKKYMIAGAISGGVVLIAGVALTGLTLYGKAQMRKIPAMSFKDCLAYTLGGSENGVITVGLIKDGEMSYAVYGEDGIELPQTLHNYEIGSLTKTFTAALIQKAVGEGKINLNDTLDTYLPLPDENSYPTIAELLTHTSGYKDWYLEAPMIGNFFAGRNDFCGITGETALDKLRLLDVRRAEHSFQYSNFSYASLGLVLKSVYGEEYTALVNRFARYMGLASTHVSNGKSELPGGWDWHGNDVYLSAGALVSNIEDMLKYARLQLGGGEIFGECHKVIKKIDATSEDNALMDINMDAIGMAWITDEENGIVWHNGGTGHYNCYLGFRPETGTAVVILSNLAPSYRIPATVMGVKLLKETDN